MTKKENREQKNNAQAAGLNTGDALVSSLPSSLSVTPNTGASAAKPTKQIVRDVYWILPDLIDADPTQPRGRESFDDDEGLQLLAKSIARDGQFHAAGVFPNPAAPGRYILIFGERRWRAGKMVLAEQPDFRLLCKIWPEKPDDLQLLLMRTAETKHRKDWTVAEFGEACRQLIEKGMSYAEVG
jgi:ParB/RepB/Spo0J family partition protein